MKTSRKSASAVHGLERWNSVHMPDVALALGLSSRGRFDVGPDLLLLVHAGVDSERVEAWGLLLAEDLVQRAGLDNPALAKAIASDCLGFAATRKSRPVAAIATEHGIRKAVVGGIRRSLDGLIRRCCEEAVARLDAVIRGRELKIPAIRHSGIMDNEAPVAVAAELTRADLWRLLEARWTEYANAPGGFLETIREQLPPVPSDPLLQALLEASDAAVSEKYGKDFAAQVTASLAERMGLEHRLPALRSRLVQVRDPRFVAVVIEVDMLSPMLGKLYLQTSARVPSEAFVRFTGEFVPGQAYSAGDVVTFDDAFHYASSDTDATPGTSGAWEPWWPPTAAEFAEEINALDFGEFDWSEPQPIEICDRS